MRVSRGAHLTRGAQRYTDNTKKNPPAATVVVDKMTLDETRLLLKAYMRTQLAEETFADSQVPYLHQFTAGTPGELFRFAKYN